MNTVLVQELLRYNKLNSIIVKSLTATMQAMKGIIIVLSEELEKLGTQFVLWKNSREMERQ